jgi:hypothetical protein
MNMAVLTPRLVLYIAVAIPEHPYASSSTIKQASKTPISIPPAMLIFYYSIKMQELLRTVVPVAYSDCEYGKLVYS